MRPTPHNPAPQRGEVGAEVGGLMGAVQDPALPPAPPGLIPRASSRLGGGRIRCLTLSKAGSLELPKPSLRTTGHGRGHLLRPSGESHTCGSSSWVAYKNDQEEKCEK